MKYIRDHLDATACQVCPANPARKESRASADRGVCPVTLWRAHRVRPVNRESAVTPVYPAYPAWMVLKVS